jgi:hypothetical protein
VDGGVRVLRVVVVKGQALGLVTCNHDSWLQAMAHGGEGVSLNLSNFSNLDWTEGLD